MSQGPTADSQPTLLKWALNVMRPGPRKPALAGSWLIIKYYTDSRPFSENARHLSVAVCALNFLPSWREIAMKHSQHCSFFVIGLSITVHFCIISSLNVRAGISDIIVYTPLHVNSEL